MKFVLSRETTKNLSDIEDYTMRRWGKAQREKYLRDIFDAFARLAERPELGHLRSDVPPPFLVYGVGSHLIVYRQNENLQRIEVLTILHPAMNLETRLLAMLKPKGSNS